MAEPTTQPPQATTGGVWRFYLLGEWRVEYQGRELPPPPYRTHGLLAALVLKPRPLARERLIGILFPDLSERAGRKRLSDLLWLLRAAFPDLPLLATPTEVGLSAESRWLDVEQFNRYYTQSMAGDSLESCQRGLAYYRGDLLPGCLDEWLLAEREMLRSQYVRLLHHTGRLLLRRHQFEAALPIAQRLLHEEPLDEEAVRLMMRAYAMTGQRGAALAAYERFASLAAAELGIEPDETTRALAHSIRTADPHALGKSAPVPVDTSPDQLLRQARAALDQADVAAATTCLEHLKQYRAAGKLANSSTLPDAVHLLEIDVALLREDYELAGRLLGEADKDQAASLVRAARLARLQHEMAVVQPAASQALLLAHQAGDRRHTMEALLELGEAQHWAGQGSQALKSVEEALRLAQQSGSPVFQAQVRIVQGRIMMRLGYYREALPIFYQAESLAREHNLRRHLAESLRGIGTIQADRGEFLDALTTMEQELSLWRDLGLPMREAEVLQNLATIYLQLGKPEESLQRLEQAQAYYQRTGDLFRAACAKYHISVALLWLDEQLAERAIELAQSAVAYFHHHNQPHWEAGTLASLGQALLSAQQFEAALEAYQRAHAMHERLGELEYLPEMLAYQGLALLGLGRPEQASALTQQALLGLAQGAVDNEIASEIYYAHAQAMVARGDEKQAQDYFKRAYENLVRYAAQLEDEAARQAFFNHNPFTRHLMRELYARKIAQPPGSVTRKLPARRDPARRVQVSWTLDAGPADAALRQAEGAIALRRNRLSRLLREAQTQGGRATVEQLADALGVSARTIKRDLAALRQSHPGLS